MSLIGNPIITTNYTSDSFSGDNSTVAFTLSQAPASAQSIAVYISGLYQIPNSAYTISGTTLTFTGAPPTGTNNIIVLYLGVKNQNLVPSAGSITPAMLSTANVVYWSGSNNNIGIGNTTPTNLLTVTGTAALGNTTITGFANVNTTLTVSGNTVIGGAANVVITPDTGRYNNDGLRLRTSTTSQMAALTFMPTTAIQGNDVIRFYNADDVTGTNLGTVGLGWEGANNRQFGITSRSFGTGTAPTAVSINSMKLLCAQGLGGTPAFYARQSNTSAQSLSNGVSTKLVYDTVVYDTSSAYTGSTTSRFQPTIAGYYMLTATVRHGPAGMCNCNMSFYVNGSGYISGGSNQQNSNDQSMVLTALVYLNGSQYVEVWYNQNGGSTVTTSNSDNLGNYNTMTWWQGVLIRAA